MIYLPLVSNPQNMIGKVKTWVYPWSNNKPLGLHAKPCVLHVFQYIQYICIRTQLYTDHTGRFQSSQVSSMFIWSFNPRPVRLAALHLKFSWSPSEGKRDAIPSAAVRSGALVPAVGHGWLTVDKYRGVDPWFIGIIMTQDGNYIYQLEFSQLGTTFEMLR